MSFRGTSGIEIRFPGSEALEITPFVRRFVWNESMLQGGFSWELHLTSDFWNEWNDMILGRTDFQVRLLFQNPDGTEESTDWRTAVVDHSNMSFRSTALSFAVYGADRRLELLQNDRTRAWLATTVSEVVRDIGQEYGFDTLIERTTHRTDHWQARVSDWRFMRLLAQSGSSGSGRGDMYLWLDEDKLYFQAPQLQQRSVRRHVMQELENRVDRIVLSYHGREIDRRGGATLRAVGFNLDTKQETVYTLDASRTSTQPALARRVPRAQSDGFKVIPSASTGQEAELEETVRAHWGRLAPRYFSMRLDTRPDLTLKPSSVIEIQGDLGVDQDTPFLGRFAVLEVQHMLEAGDPADPHTGGMVTTAVCYRREAYSGDDEPLGANVTNVGTRDRYRLGQEQTPDTVVVSERLPS